MPIPALLATDYQGATSQTIRSWSYGDITLRTGDVKRDDDSGKKGTLHDQRIFGPRQDNRCACGKYEGQQFQGMICDRCGVKVGPSSLRRTRFAHIELNDEYPHPLAEYASIACFPVLPARYLEAPAGKPLFDLYEELIDSVAQDEANSIRWALGAICDQLLPVVSMAHNWRLTDAPLLASGLALELKREAAIYCGNCGYLLAGLESTACPGCGQDVAKAAG